MKGSGGKDGKEGRMGFEIYRIPSGVPGLDDMVEGGLPFPSTALVAGSAGTGKTTFALQFLSKGAEQGEKGLFFSTLSEPISWMLRFSQTYEFMRREHFGKDIIYIDLYGLLRKTKNYKELLDIINDTINEHIPQRIVIDPITVISKWPGYRDFLYDIMIDLRNWNSTTLLTGENGPGEDFPVDVSYVVDGIILLSTKVMPEGSRQRYLEVLKMRGTDHVTGKHMATISKEGLSVQIGI